MTTAKDEKNIEIIKTPDLEILVPTPYKEESGKKVVDSIVTKIIRQIIDNSIETKKIIEYELASI